LVKKNAAMKMIRKEGCETPRKTGITSGKVDCKKISDFHIAEDGRGGEHKKVSKVKKKKKQRFEGCGR